MRTVSAYDDNGQLILPRVHASEIRDSTRHSYQFRCPYPDCGLVFHWRRQTACQSQRHWSNAGLHGPYQEEIPATFVKAKGEEHAKGCKYDFVKVAHQSKGKAKRTRNGLLIPISFPMGSAGFDYRFVGPNTGFKTLKQVADFAFGQFGNIRDLGFDNLQLSYDKHRAGYHWRDLWVGPDDYWELRERAHSEEFASLWGQEGPLPDPVLIVVKPIKLEEERVNKAGKTVSRFLCEEQVEGPNKWVRPVISSVSDASTRKIQKALEKPNHLLVAARPFEPTGGKSHQLRVYFQTHTERQIAVMKRDWFRVQPEQLALDLHVDPYGNPSQRVG